MSEKKEPKIYVGSGKESAYGVKFSLCLDKISEEWIFEYGGKRYVKLEVTKKKEVDEYGKTHTVTVDTWRPDRSEGKQEPASEPNGKASKIDDPSDDLPF